LLFENLESDKTLSAIWTNKGPTSEGGRRKQLLSRQYFARKFFGFNILGGSTEIRPPANPLDP
jgi:hypothetical protein